MSSTEGKPKVTSFFDEVDEIMKRDSPLQYQRFLESKAASESWREMQQRNERSRKRLEKEHDAAIEAKTSVMPNILSPPARIVTPNKPPAFANYDNRNVANSSTQGETPFKGRNDMSDFTSGRATENMNVDRDTPSTMEKITTLPNKYQNFMQKKPEEPSKTNIVSENDGPSVKKSGIFSSISKSALNIKDANGATSTSIPFSELFPTLYSNNDAQKKESTLNKKPVNPAMMYDPDHFEAYQQAMTAVLADQGAVKVIKKFEARGDLEKKIVQKVKDWLMNDHRVVDTELVKERWNQVEDAWKDDKWMTGMSESDSTGGEEKWGKTGSRFRSELQAQQDIFLSKLLSEGMDSVPGSDDESSPEEQSEELTVADVDPVLFYDISRHIMGTLGRYCARRARSSPMVVAWWKVKESGLLVSKDTISTFLYVVGTMGMADSIGMSGGIGLSSYPISDNKNGQDGDGNIYDEENRFLIPEEVATYHDLSSKPTESSISLRVKALASKGDAKSAEELLEAFKKSIEADKSSKELIRLRTYLPILKQYCEEGEISSALSLFKRMQSTQGVILEPETYVMLIASIAENKWFCENSPPIEGAIDLGYNHSHGPGLFDELATEMASDALEITSASARRLYNSLAIGFQSESNFDNENTIVSTLKEVHPLVSMPLTNQPTKSDEVVASKVSLNRSTGICPVTNAQQRLIILEPDQRQQLHDDLLSLSTEQFAKFAGRKSSDSPDRAREQLQFFSDWLAKRQGEPFTAIVDGANIGYYMQSFDKGRFNYHQIKFMVDTLEERGENPLVVIPYKYGFKEFYSSKREHQRLDPAEIEIMRDLTESGKLYKVPPRCLDDFYWMLASVSDQTVSRKGQDLSVSNNDPDGRFPGSRPMLISNDQMRDHKLELLSGRLFRRWNSCHIVNYNFTAFVLGESVQGNEVGFSPADFFSREIQGNQCPGNSDERDDANWGGTAWHFPVNDWELDERFVIRIPAK
eukprot:CAMPEP_0172298480 /NCGR_PEP_ID=MMETSP1058-20130122/1116_1 /TAXON_ID=83371 /ORGANISM="Detonula confervacea, Strain CCMP 353" /LENGTH=981 /DNA_ID=CAMNT_0013007755 /DNA_START=554 /DNA_END=3496 /DNA_ORIENTATION=-